MVKWVSIGRPVFWWTGMRTLAKGKPLPGPSSHQWGQVHLVLCDEPCSFSGCVGTVIGAPVTLGVAAQLQVAAQTHIGAAVHAGAVHGRQANRGEDVLNATTERWCTTEPEAPQVPHSNTSRYCHGPARVSAWAQREVDGILPQQDMPW